MVGVWVAGVWVAGVWVVGDTMLGGSEVTAGGTVVAVLLVEVVYVALNPLNSDVPSVISSTVRMFPTDVYRRFDWLGRPESCAQREVGAQIEPSHTLTRS